MGLKDILGDGKERPPAPEVADAEDVEKYNLEYAKSNGLTPDFGGGRDESDSITGDVAKQDADEMGRNTKHKAEFPWLRDPQRGVRWDFDPIRLRNLSQTNTWVGMLVATITKEISETPWTIVRGGGRVETQKRLSTHPDEREPLEKQDASQLPDQTSEGIYDLLMSPNPDDTWQDLVEMWMADLLEIGSMTAVKAFHRSAYNSEGKLTADPSTVEPRAIQPSAPEVWTKDYHERTGVVDGYWQFDDHKSPGSGTTDAGMTTSMGINNPTFFDADEMLWSDMSPRTNRRYGIPPTLLVEDFLQAVDLAVSQEQQYLSRGSLPSGAMVFEEWDRKEVKEWAQANEENIKGKPWKWLTIAGKSGDVSWESFSYNFDEMQFTERMKWYARIIASAFQVPTAVVGIEPERVNYATFQGERQNFESNTLGPYLQKLERIINHDLIQPHWGSGYRFEFKPGMSESTRGMVSERVTREFQNNLRTRNEARREIGLDEVEEDGFHEDVVDESPDAADALGQLAQSTQTESHTVSRDIEKETYDDYPEAAQENARMALEAREDTGNPNDCGTRVGWERANQLDNGEALSKETVSRMAAFERHEDNKEQGEEGRADCGWLMWKAWGGDEGIEWAQDKLDEIENSAGGSGKSNKSVQKEDSLRNTDEWQQFDVQPSQIDSLTEEIVDDVEELFDSVLNNDEVFDVIDRLAAEGDDDTTEKSISALSRKLREIIDSSDTVDRIKDALRGETARAARETVENTLEDAAGVDPETDVDIQAIEEQLADREVQFADRFVGEMKDDILDTVGDGWAEGKSTQEIADGIADQSDINSGWQGAERIARQELHVATGNARSEVAGDLGKIEVWQTSSDGRVRPAHQEMSGKWKRPGEEWSVTYEDRGTRTEKVPGDSEPGIGCRCTTLLRDMEDVDSDDHAGV